MCEYCLLECLSQNVEKAENVKRRDVSFVAEGDEDDGMDWLKSVI